MAVPAGQISLSYPKRRETMQLIIPIARTDSATVKAWLPKDAVISNIMVYQDTDAVTATGSFTLGLGSDADGIVEAFTMATTAVGLVQPGVSSGVAFLVKQTADQKITSTYTVGSSTAGGTGYVILSFFIAGPGEAVDD
jgi:hypothetical protein